MASILSRAFHARPLVTGSAIAGAIGTAYYATRQPMLLDSANVSPPSKTFNFPSSMLFSKQLTVTDVEQVNHDTKKITLALPGGSEETTGVPPGAAVLTQHKPADRWFPVIRPYTPVQDPDSRGIIQFIVKHYPGGAASTYMHSLTPGSTLTLRGPIPGYTYKPAPTPRDLLFVAGGAGITPIYSLTRAIVSDEQDKTRIRLLWGVNGTRDIVLRKELDDLQAQHPERLHVTYVVSGAEGKADAPSLGDSQRWRKGYIDRSLLAESTRQYQAGAWGDDKGVKVFFCGPPTMQEAITGKAGALSELGVGKKGVHIF